MRKRNPGRDRQTKRSKPTFANDLRIYSLMAVTVAILISGFFFAARQHFSSIDYGIRNSRLRKQLDDLETEKRRLIVAREVSVSPAEIKKAVRKLGVLGPGSEIETASARTGAAAEAAPAKASQVSKGDRSAYEIVPASLSAPVAKPAPAEKVAKKDGADKEKKNRS